MKPQQLSDIPAARARARVRPALRFIALALGALGLTVAAVLLGVQAFWIEPRQLTLTTLRVESPSWPANTPPLRAVLLSDIHIDGIHSGPDRARRLAHVVELLDADVVLLAGDYVGGQGRQGGGDHAKLKARSERGNERIRKGLTAIGSIKGRNGTFAVIGNHDCWWDCDAVRTTLQASGATVLENAPAPARSGAGRVWIIGLEDGQTQRPDFEVASRGVPVGEAAIVLAHNPGLFDWASNTWPLMVAGHTHAGQVRLPFVGAPVRMSRHTEDTARAPLIQNGRVLIVTRGVGTVGLPVRFGAPPELMLLEFRHGPTARVQRFS